MGRRNPGLPVRYLLYTVEIASRAGRVRQALDEEPGGWTLELDGSTWPIDIPGDLLAATPEGAEARADFGPFALVVRRGLDGRPLYRALAQGIEGPEHKDEELALWALLEQLGDERSPRACFFCRWSDVEPSTGWGNLGCFVENADAYHRYVTTMEPRRVRQVTSAVPCTWVDEWHGCQRFEVRPPGYGYRGRPRSRP